MRKPEGAPAEAVPATLHAAGEIAHGMDKCHMRAIVWAGGAGVCSKCRGSGAIEKQARALRYRQPD